MSKTKRYTVDYRHTSLLLNLINVAQPVSHEELLETMGSDKEDDVAAALDFLIDRKLVKHLPGDNYRTTWAGQQAKRSRVLRRDRDVHRMWHLSRLSDQYRRYEEGDVS